MFRPASGTGDERRNCCKLGKSHIINSIEIYAFFAIFIRMRVFEMYNFNSLFHFMGRFEVYSDIKTCFLPFSVEQFHEYLPQFD